MGVVDKQSRVQKLEELLRLSTSMSSSGLIEAKLLDSVATGVLNGGEGDVVLVYEIAVLLLKRIDELKGLT